jgi:hypothetical protein
MRCEITVKKMTATQYEVTVTETDTDYSAVGLGGSFTFDTLTSTPSYIMMFISVGNTAVPTPGSNFFAESLFKWKIAVSTEGHEVKSYRHVF